MHMVGHSEVRLGRGILVAEPTDVGEFVLIGTLFESEYAGGGELHGVFSSQLEGQPAGPPQIANPARY
jgi:hypothetical protein